MSIPEHNTSSAPPEGPTPLEKKVVAGQRRKLQARRNDHRSVWFGLGMFGLVGWSVAAPALAGIAVGLWIDSRWPSRVSWTLTLLFVGVSLGCYNAWRWIREESRDEDNQHE